MINHMLEAKPESFNQGCFQQWNCHKNCALERFVALKYFGDDHKGIPQNTSAMFPSWMTKTSSNIRCAVRIILTGKSDEIWWTLIALQQNQLKSFRGNHFLKRYITNEIIILHLKYPEIWWRLDMETGLRSTVPPPRPGLLWPVAWRGKSYGGHFRVLGDPLGPLDPLGSELNL